MFWKVFPQRNKLHKGGQINNESSSEFCDEFLLEGSKLDGYWQITVARSEFSGRSFLKRAKLHNGRQIYFKSSSKLCD